MITIQLKKKIKKYGILILSFCSFFFSMYSAQNKSWYENLFYRIFAPKRYESMQQRPTAPLTTEFVSSTLQDADLRSAIGQGLVGSFATGLTGMYGLSVILALPATVFASLTILTGLIDTLHYYDNKKYIVRQEQIATQNREAQVRAKKEGMIKSAQASLALLIAQNDLYPTRSSKINMLIGPDFEGELIRYVGHKDIMIEARDRVLKTIAESPVGDNDAIIDGYASKLREEMAKAKIDIFNLEDQINYLNNKKHEKITPIEGQGYTSLLKRLQNRAKIEKHFASLKAASAA